MSCLFFLPIICAWIFLVASVFHDGETTRIDSTPEQTDKLSDSLERAAQFGTTPELALEEAPFLSFALLFTFAGLVLTTITSFPALLTA